MDDPAGIQITALVILILLSAFFSGTETAYTSFNKTRMKTLAQDGSRKAKRVLEIEEKYDKFLSTMLVGNNIVNIAASAIATLMFTAFLNGNASKGATVSTIVMTVLVLLFGEITPKCLSKDFAESYTLATGGIVKFIMALFTPLTFVFSLWRKMLAKLFKSDGGASITEDEIITMVEEAQSEGGIDEHEGDLIRSAIEFNDLEVSEILTPRVDIAAISVETPVEEIMELFRSSGFSRLPVYSETIDNIVGVIHEKDFNQLYYDGKKDITGIIHEVMCITEGMKISKLLRKFQEEKAHMAVVVDEYGGTAGVVTLEDVLEGLVGEIWDEHDEVIENIKQIGENEYLVNCATSMNDLEDIYDFSEEEIEDNATVNGWILDKLGEIPEVGDTFDYENLSVEVTQVDGRRASEIKITVHPKNSGEDEKEKTEKTPDDEPDEKN
jgi:CBS domain containing-hemolysin-like protein